MPRTNPKSERIEEAKRLRRLRGSLQLSQRELASEFNVARGAISFWESGARTIPGPILRLIEIYEVEAGLQDNTKGLRKLSASWLTRNFKLSFAAAGIAAKFAGGSLRKWMISEESTAPLSEMHVSALKQLRDTLGDFKGLLMKLGQMMSYVDCGIPVSAQEILSSLQDSSTPMKAEVIEKVIGDDLGKPPEALFSEWNPRPVSAASIGQVHWAKTADGREVAVKVQYPNILMTVESDLSNTKVIELLSSTFFRRQDRTAFMSELRERFKEECDYKKEAENQKFFRQCFANHKDVLIPEVLPEYSSKHVLTTQFMHGKRLKDFIATATKEERNKAGAAIFKVAFTSVFKHGVLNGDPHPGNYVFCEDGKVAFLDFGCVKWIDPIFIALWKRYMRAVLENDRVMADSLVAQMGYAPDETDFDFAYNQRMIEYVYRPWLFDKSFKFTHEYVAQAWELMVLHNPNLSKTNLPKDWIFVNRLQWGLFSVLATLEAEANWHEILLPLLS